MKLLPLFLIELVAFLLIIAETYVFFIIVVPLGPIPHTLTEYTSFALLKVVLILALGGVWFLVLDELTNLYVRSKIGSSPRPSS
ncbi:MAG: hypothetical protein JRN28_02620 [Nitrososphaerota archaeon]|nr:hypothetical protein [Nitrososphaerota archaeon]